MKPMKCPGRRFATGKHARLASLVLAAAASPAASAQAVDTNRPGFSATPGIVADGRWQLETGVVWDRPDGESRTLALPVAEVRLGIADGVEVFVSPISWADTESNGNAASGLLDMAIGSKIALSAADVSTRMAVLLQVSVPVGASGLSSDRWDPSAAFVWAHDGSVSLAGTVKLGRYRDGFQLDNGLKMPFSLGDRHSVFLEWEARLPEGGGDAHWLNGGYQWLFEDTLQLDAGAGFGLNDRAGDYRLGLGFSALF